MNGGTSGDAWSYDSTGNRSQVGTSDGYGNGNRITSFGSATISHDSVGAIVCRITGTCPGGAGSGVKYGWDALGRLRVVKDGSSGAVVDSFYYDPQGRRVKKKKPTGGSEYYVYEGSQVILDVDSTGAVLREYAWFPGAIDRLLALRTPTDTFAAVLDPQIGSVRGLARFRTGARVKEYAELPWGDTAADTGFTVRYRFAGREYDQETGLYYMRARYYDPALGRWISEDPIGAAGGLNLYAYVGNDPITLTDPSGEDPLTICFVDIWYTYEYPPFEVISTRHESRQCFTAGGSGSSGGGSAAGAGGWAFQPDGASSPSEGKEGKKSCGPEVSRAVVSSIIAVAPYVISGGTVVLARGAVAAARTFGYGARALAGAGRMSRARLAAGVAWQSLSHAQSIRSVGGRLTAVADAQASAWSIGTGIASPAETPGGLALTVAGVLSAEVTAALDIYSAYKCVIQ